jgi:hypothetical protein
MLLLAYDCGVDLGELTPMPRVAPVIAQDTIFRFVDIRQR